MLSRVQQVHVLLQSWPFSKSFATFITSIRKNVIMRSLCDKVNIIYCACYLICVQFRESHKYPRTLGMSAFMGKFSFVVFHVNFEICVCTVTLIAVWFRAVKTFSVDVMCSFMFFPIAGIIKHLLSREQTASTYPSTEGTSILLWFERFIWCGPIIEF